MPATWTAPKTYTATTLSVADMNAYQRDNLLWVKDRIGSILRFENQDMDAAQTVYVPLAVEGPGVGEGVPMPAAGTISHLYAESDVAPSSGDSFTLTVMKNGSAQSVTCAISDTATAANDTSNSFTVTAGDLINIRMVATAGTPANTAIYAALRFSPS